MTRPKQAPEARSEGAEMPPYSLIHRNNSPKPASMRVAARLTLSISAPGGIDVDALFTALQLLDLARSGVQLPGLAAHVFASRPEAV